VQVESGRPLAGDEVTDGAKDLLAFDPYDSPFK